MPELIAELEAADLVVGFNSRRFDYEVLSGYTGIDYARRLPTLDLLDSVQTLSVAAWVWGRSPKSTSGLERVRTARSRSSGSRPATRTSGGVLPGRDVEILRDLYLLGRRMGRLEYRDSDGEKKSFDVDW